jgi:hypothetical protein
MHYVGQDDSCHTYVPYLPMSNTVNNQFWLTIFFSVSKNPKCAHVSWGHAVAQLVEALLYKSEGRGLDSRWCHWNFSLT